MERFHKKFHKASDVLKDETCINVMILAKMISVPTGQTALHSRWICTEVAWRRTFV
ncbi:hypothetical protein AGR4A_pAt20033 [Agrobacterium tumefaciens str. B6]|uniref:Uncharacterized protein n=1 Tax=Agrobacterium tumefaciens str. B6 TaxID=1183423 RepID=A0A822VDI4_AGRTU|nr:hypothetical protein AGR4A_pAt20033 [Agrobacterium tumefaciens str. B6]